jgi:hypothetical protein
MVRSRLRLIINIAQWEATNMADDRMKNDDLDRNMGSTGQRNKDDFGQQGQQQSPGRHQQDDLSTGQRGTGQGQQNQPKHEEDDFGTGGAGKTGGGQRNQNR